MTKQERQYYEKLTSFGCIVCRLVYDVYAPAEVHHIRHEAGVGRKSEFDKTLPLCPQHHRLGGYGVSYHAGRRGFEQAIGYTEVELLEITKELMRKL